MTRDWLQWHEKYEAPGSSLARRLLAVQANIRSALDEGPCEDNGTRRLISMCAGDGRDVLPILAERHDRAVQARLVELDPTLAQRARATAARLGLSAVTVVTADAGTIDPYLAVAPAHVILACGVFGNISVEDARGLVATMSSLLVEDGLVIWTRGRSDDGTDRSLDIRTWLSNDGFTEVCFARPDDVKFQVGMHRSGHRSANAGHPRPGTRIFTFRS